MYYIDEVKSSLNEAIATSTMKATTVSVFTNVLSLILYAVSGSINICSTNCSQS